MKDPKENPWYSFFDKETKEEDKLEDKLEGFLSGMTEADFRYEEEGRKEMSNMLHLNMEKTREEFEVLYTRL